MWQELSRDRGDGWLAGTTDVMHDKLIAAVDNLVCHPRADHPDRDYFAVTQYSETFTFAGQEGTLTYWHRPLHAMTDAFTAAGFRISVVSEPPYATDTPREILPPELENISAFVCFLFFVLEAA